MLGSKVLPPYTNRFATWLLEPYQTLFQGLASGDIKRMATLYSGISSSENAPSPIFRQSGNTI
jgi:hypothetical protein